MPPWALRKVVYSRALSNRVTPAFIEAVRSEVDSNTEVQPQV